MPSGGSWLLVASHSSRATVSTCISMRRSAHFGQWLVGHRRGRRVRQWQVGTGLIYGQVKKSYQRRKLVRVSHGLAPGDRGRSDKRLAKTGVLWTTEHGFHRASESHGPECAWQLSRDGPGRRRSSLHSCWRIWSGGACTIILSDPIPPCESGSCSRENEGAGC
jgi:hypothetical protein